MQLSSNVIVRIATEADAPAIAGLTEQLGYPADSNTMRDRIRKVLGSKGQSLLVAESPSGELSGWIQAVTSDVLESGFRVEIVGLVVGEKFRRAGIGKRLVIAAESWAQTVGADTIVVRSNTKRIESHQFYPALGYVASKTQTVYRKGVVRGETEC